MTTTSTTPLTRHDAAHLLRRAAFGGTLAEVDAFVGWQPEQAVLALLDWPDGDAGGGIAPGALAALRDPTSPDRYAPLQQYWYGRLTTDPFPLREKLTLFWHGHFTSELRRVGDYGLMYDQNQLLRAGAKGSFIGLLKSVTLHPAMLIYLDNASSRKGNPNVNFARELLELYTLGVGHYTEGDVYSMAAAWTGYGVDSSTAPPTMVFHDVWHETAAGTFLGGTGVWDATGQHGGANILDRLFDPSQQERMVSALFVARKMFEFFAYESPADAVVEELALAFSGSDFSIAELVRAVLVHPEFWSQRAREGRVRSPVEWFVAAMRYTKVTGLAAHPDWYNRALGQELFNPPDVSGWKLNENWIGAAAFWAKGTSTINFRWTVVDLVSKGAISLLPDIEADPTLSAPELAQRAFEAFGILLPSPQTRSVIEQLITNLRIGDARYLRHGLVDALLLSPEFQMA